MEDRFKLPSWTPIYLMGKSNNLIKYSYGKEYNADKMAL
jgi:hypothetical protein